MMGAQPGSNFFEWAKAELQHRDRRQQREAAAAAAKKHNKAVQSNSFRVLQAIYDRTRAQSDPVFVTELDIGLSEEDSKAAWRYLRDRGLIQTFNLDYTARINAPGVDTIENAQLHPDQPISGFPLTTYNIVNIGTAIHSSVQQAGAQSTQAQCTTDGSVRTPDLARLVAELADHLDELGLDGLLSRKAEAQIATLKAQLTDEPDPLIVQQAGRTLRSITEGAIGSLLATAAQPHVWHWIQQAMATLFPK
jgi:hypothetical protein